MPAKQKDEVIALNLPLDLSRAASFRERTRGKRKKKMTYSLQIKSDPIAVKVNAYSLGKESAAALQEAFVSLIKKAGNDTSIDESTRKRRDVYVGQYQRGNSTARKRFDSPRKKDGTLRKNAKPDSPPSRGEYGWFNHSGRLREGSRLSGCRQGFHGTSTLQLTGLTVKLLAKGSRLFLRSLKEELILKKQ